MLDIVVSNAFVEDHYIFAVVINIQYKNIE